MLSTPAPYLKGHAFNIRSTEYPDWGFVSSESLQANTRLTSTFNRAGLFLLRGPGSVVGTATAYGLGGPGIESRWGARFSAPVQTGPGGHPASCTMGTGSFPGVKSGRGVTLTPHPLLVPWSWKSRAIPLLPYGPYGTYTASVPVQGCNLPFPSASSWLRERVSMLRYMHNVCHVWGYQRTLTFYQRIWLTTRGMWPPRSPNLNPCNIIWEGGTER